MININELKENLTIEQIEEIVYILGGEPSPLGPNLICSTICHNEPGMGSRKLYYYSNTQLFKCFTNNCGDNGSFDIFELIIRAKKVQTGQDWTLFQAISLITSHFGIAVVDSNEIIESLDDWKIFNAYDRIKEVKDNKELILQTYDDKILKFLPQPRIQCWEQEYITKEISHDANIKYEPSSNSIVIPHYDKNNRLVGIRTRTLSEDEEYKGKYRPLKLLNTLYNHPLGYNLYNFNKSKDNIAAAASAFIFESEKATLQFRSYFGNESDISVAVCGSSLTIYQVEMLIEAGARELIIGFDKQFQNIGDNEFQKLTKQLSLLHKRYSKYATVSFLFDKQNLLGYKDSPTDRGKEILLKLYKERVYL